MSLCCTVLRAANDELARLIQHPEELDDFLDVKEVPATGALRGLFPVDDWDGSALTTVEFARFTEQVDLDKNWHALHFLLTGEADGGKSRWVTS